VGINRHAARPRRSIQSLSFRPRSSLFFPPEIFALSCFSRVRQSTRVRACRPQDLRDQVGQLLVRLDSLSGLQQSLDRLAAADRGQADQPRRLKSAMRKAASASPRSQRQPPSWAGASVGRNSSSTSTDVRVAGGSDAAEASDGLGQTPSVRGESQDKVCRREFGTAQCASSALPCSQARACAPAHAERCV
jgi:hypothetical protein